MGKVADVSAEDENIQRIAKVSSELVEFRDKAKNQSANLSNYVSTHIDESINHINAWLNTKNIVSTNALDRLRSLKEKISAYLLPYMESRLSTTNKELAVIIGESDNDKRKSILGTFYVRSFRYAVTDVNSMVENAFDDTCKELLATVGNDSQLAHKIRQITYDECEGICVSLRDFIQKSKEETPDDYLRLQDIARQLGWDYFGDGDFPVRSLRYADEAQEDALVFVYSDREVRNVGAIITEPRLLPSNANFIHCYFQEIDEALAKVAGLFIAAGLSPDYTKKPHQQMKDGAMIGEDAKIGEGTIIEPFVSVGDDVIIGRNCRIEAGVFIGSGSRIGNNVTILSGSRIGVNAHYHYRENRRHKGFVGLGRAIIKDGAEIGANTIIQRGTLSDTVVGTNTVIGNLVEIAHDVKIGAGCLIVSQV